MLINELPLKSIIFLPKNSQFFNFSFLLYIFSKKNLYLKFMAQMTHSFDSKRPWTFYYKKPFFVPAFNSSNRTLALLLHSLICTECNSCLIIFLFQYLFAFFGLLDLTRWWGDRPMVVFLLSGHDWSHEFVIFLFILFGLHRCLYSQFLKDIYCHFFLCYFLRLTISA